MAVSRPKDLENFSHYVGYKWPWNGRDRPPLTTLKEVTSVMAAVYHRMQGGLIDPNHGSALILSLQRIAKVIHSERSLTIEEERNRMLGETGGVLGFYGFRVVEPKAGASDLIDVTPPKTNGKGSEE